MFPRKQLSKCPCHPRTKSQLPSFKVHLMEPVLLLTACRLPSSVDTNSKVSGSVTVLGLPKPCSERYKHRCGQHDSSSWVCTTTDQPLPYPKSFPSKIHHVTDEETEVDQLKLPSRACVWTTAGLGLEPDCLILSEQQSFPHKGWWPNMSGMGDSEIV